MTYDPDKIYHELIEAGEEWAEAKSVYQQLEDHTKSVLADIKNSYEGSDANKTTHALADSSYIRHLDAVARARKDFLYCQVKYDSVKALSDHRRTEQATRRAEIHHIQ